MPLGVKTVRDLANDMRMPEAAVQELIARGMVPIPYDVDDVVQEANAKDPNAPFHVRDCVPAIIWFKQYISERMRIGKGFYDYPTRIASFIGFDADRVAVYQKN
jgi:hypothetical protein